MNQLLLTVGDKEYRLKATTAAVDAAEKSLGCSLLDAMGSIDRTASFAAILWAGLQKYNHGYPMQRVYSLIDDILEQGCSFNGRVYDGAGLEVRAELALEILKVSGFFTITEIAAMEATMPRPPQQENTVTTNL